MRGRDTTPDVHADQPGLSPRETDVADAVARLDLGAHPPSGAWETLARSAGFQQVLVDAVRDLLADAPPRQRVSTLYDAGVTAASGGYARLVAGLDRAPETDAHQDALALTAQLGQDGMSRLGHLGTDAIGDGPLAILQAADAVPTVAVRIGDAFRDRRRDQREVLLELLADLASACDVAVVMTRYTGRWLLHEHRAQLPTEFIEFCNARWLPDTDVDEVVTEARAEFDPDGRPVRTLRLLAEDAGQTLPQAGLVGRQEVGKATVSQVVTELEDADLVRRFSLGGHNQVELLPAGAAFLDTLDEEIGRQRRLDDEFSETGQAVQRTCNPHVREGRHPEGSQADQPAEAADAPYRTRWTNRAHHAAAAAAATEGAVTTVNAPLPATGDAEDRRTRLVSYDADRDEVLVSVHATSPLQYMVSVATGLASPRLFDEVLPTTCLESIDESAHLLRDARCIGGLSSEAVEDAEVLRDTLVEWKDQLESMTTDLHRDECEDRDRLCDEILRSAHGLAGTIVHLLDVAGVDVVRELCVPSNLAASDREQLAETVAVASSIQSRYGHFAAYRQLFEGRDEKRESALSPDVDAADPVGEYIGGLVIRSPAADDLATDIAAALEEPATLHEDAPEFAVRVPVRQARADRTITAEAVARMGSLKNLSVTSEAVTLFRTLAADVYAATEALHWLAPEDRRRDIRLDEVRVALGKIDAGRLLPDAPPSARQILQALLRSERPLSRSELADAADVSTRSVRRHLDALVALDLVRETDHGLRLALPFPTDERGAEIAPTAVTDDLTAAQDLVYELVLARIDDRDRFGDPDDPVCGQFISGSYDFDRLQAHLPGLTPWVEAAKHLCDAPDPPPTTVTFGATVEQTPLQSPTAKTAEVT